MLSSVYFLTFMNGQIFKDILGFVIKHWSPSKFMVGEAYTAALDWLGLPLNF